MVRYATHATVLIFIFIATGVISPFQLFLAHGQTASGWQKKWEQVLKAAKEEGVVAVTGPPGSNARLALTEGFQKSYPGISVEYTGASSSSASARLLRERRAKHYLVDVHVGGTTTMLTTLRPVGALEPLKPALILPGSSDPTKWLKGRLDFSDEEEKYNLVFTSAVNIPVAINPELVRGEDIRSFKDLLHPKWAGKIAMRDPTVAGVGLATVTHWYAHPALGTTFIRDLFVNQKVVFSRNNQQLLDWVTRGRYAIVISPSELAASALQQKGIHVELIGADQFKEGGYLTAATGSVALIRNAPHPHAATVYVNWLLSREAQIAWSEASGYPSRRLDVPKDKVNALSVPKEGHDYQENYREKYVRMRDDIRALLREVIRRN
ncbi:MAG TPA: extracellular solute-binding protein [Candidatus Binatia bacterium]